MFIEAIKAEQKRIQRFIDLSRPGGKDRGSLYVQEQEGFILGKNYFVTSDDPDYGTDSQMIAGLVDRIEQMFYGF